jgi:hypothetical protein
MPSMMEKILEKIKSRGYWRVVIRPSKFEKERISELSKCKTLVRDNAVHLRGWDYPHYDMRTEPSCGLDYIEQFTDWEPHIEAWRLYQSGQFVHYKALWEDWEDLSPWGQSQQILSVIGTVYLLTEIYEFASRLGAKGILGDSCEIQITLSNTVNRKLATLDAIRPVFAEYKTTLSEIPRSVSLVTADILSRSAELSLEHAVWLYQRFNWLDVQAEIFKEDQRELLEKRY